MKTKKQHVTPGAMRGTPGKRKAADKPKPKNPRQRRSEIPPLPGGLLVRGIPQLPDEDGK